jgi:hypothetical protein
MNILRQFSNRFAESIFRWACAILLLGLATVPIVAQQITGVITGTVTDQSGAMVTGATVRATNVNTGFARNAPTNEYGVYRVDYLPVGTYTIEVNAANFKKFIQKNLALSVDQTLTFPIALEIGAETQTVTVSTAPPLVETSSAELGRTISTTEIAGLPLVNRNVYSQLSLTPGVMANSASSQSNASGTPNFTIGLPSTNVQINGSVDGGNPQVSFYLDGGLNINGIRNYGNQLPNPDALEEFRVETSNFSAQYGHMSSAVVTAVTKSGTNHFHGSLFESNRNTIFNAVPWGQTTSQPYHRNQFGGSVGGPVMKDKAFFFFSYGGLRMVVGSPMSGAIVPTDAERLGDFTADTGLTLYMPGTASSTKVPIVGTNSSPNCQTAKANCIPTALLDKTSGNIMNTAKLIPLPNGTLNANSSGKLIGGGHWNGYFTGPTNNNEYLGKYDQVIGDKDHVTASYFYIRTTQNANGNSSTGSPFIWATTQSYTNQTNVNVSDVHTFSPNIANQVWLTFTQAAGGRVNLPATDLGKFGSAFTIQGPSALPQFNLTGYFNVGGNLAGPVTTSDFYSIRDVVTMAKGKHSIAYGGEFALDKGMFYGNLYNFGVFTFQSSAPTGTGNALADFVTGQINSMEQDTPYQTLMSAWHTAVFLQDNYRITPRFTANLGIRWDIDTPPVESRDHTVSWVAGQQSTVVPSAPLGVLFPGDKGIGRGIVSTKWYHVAPRIGLAWDPWGDGKTAIRAGAGVFYGVQSGNAWNQPGNAQPFAVRQTFTLVNSISDPYNPKMVNGTTSSFPNGNIFPYNYDPKSPRWLKPIAAIETIPPDIKWPFSYQFNLAVQRQMPGQVSATVAYVGSISRNVPTMIDANYAPWTSTATSSNIDTRRPFYSVGVGQNIYLITNQTANYHSLQISGTRPMTHNLLLNGFYVWSHAIQSSDESAIGQMTAQDFNNLWEEKGPMNADRRHISNISAVWKLDYYTGSNSIAKQVVNGWTISPIYYVQSGNPVEIVTGSNKNFDSSNHNRPNLVPGVNATLDPHRCRVCGSNSVVNQWFNTAAFTQNGAGLPGGIGPGGADGNTSRNYLRGPGYRNVDLGILRDFHIWESAVLQLRGEATNVFNIVSLSNPTANLNSGDNGKIKSANTMRVMQFGARFTF